MSSDATTRATALNKMMDAEVEALSLPEPRTLATEIRAFLLANEQEDEANQPQSQVKVAFSRKTVAQIELGPSLDKGDNGEDYFRFDGGARLSFGITVAAEDKVWRLKAYRFQISFADEHCPEYVRFDLNSDSLKDPLLEPRSHIHVGMSNGRVPGRVLSPLQILDVIFFSLVIA